MFRWVFESYKKSALTSSFTDLSRPTKTCTVIHPSRSRINSFRQALVSCNDEASEIAHGSPGQLLLQQFCWAMQSSKQRKDSYWSLPWRTEEEERCTVPDRWTPPKHWVRQTQGERFAGTWLNRLLLSPSKPAAHSTQPHYCHFCDAPAQLYVSLENVNTEVEKVTQSETRCRVRRSKWWWLLKTKGPILGQ